MKYLDDIAKKISSMTVDLIIRSIPIIAMTKISPRYTPIVFALCAANTLVFVRNDPQMWCVNPADFNQIAQDTVYSLISTLQANGFDIPIEVPNPASPDHMGISVPEGMERA